MKIKVKQDSELLKYLYDYLNLPKKKIKSLLTHKMIYINNQPVTQYNFKIYKDMELTICDKNRCEFPFPILYEDHEIIVVDKPSGLLTIATIKEKENNLYHYVSAYLKKKDKNSKIFVVHRLDQATSGVVVFAKNQRIKNILQKNWNDFAKIREYKAIVTGTLKKKQGKLVHYLSSTKTNLVYISKNKNGKEAITNYSVEKENSNYTMLNIQIETGRKNQIRVQLASIGNPIVGDTKYGEKNQKFSRLYLHANKLVLFYPVLKKEMIFTSQVPKEFQEII